MSDISGAFAAPAETERHPRILLSWGSFEFSIDTLAYRTLQRTAEWRWAEQALIGKTDCLQYTGKSARTVKLEGETHAGFGGGPEYIDKLYDLCDEGAPQLVVAGTGDIFGYWVATGLSDSTPVLLPGGGARSRNFTLDLKYYGEKLQNA